VYYRANTKSSPSLKESKEQGNRTDSAVGYSHHMAPPCSHESFSVYEDILQAANAGKTETVLALLADHAPAAIISSEALLYAASNGHANTLRALVSSCRADVRYTSDSGWTATMYAAYNGHTQAVVALVRECGASPEEVSPAGRTPIMYAASNGHTETAIALVQLCGADPHRQDSNGASAIMYASAAGHSATAMALKSTCNVIAGSSGHKLQSLSQYAAPPVLKLACSRPKTGVKVISCHLPRKVSTPPVDDLFTVLEA